MGWRRASPVGGIGSVERMRLRRTEEDSLIGLVEHVRAADLVDAMGRLHRHRCHVLDLVTPTPGRVLFGEAVTISYFPTCNAGLDPEQFNFGSLFYQAVGDEPRGKVLVLASNGHPETSLAGGTKLARAQNLRMGGVLADGRIRDFDELAGYDFPVYCGGEATRWGGDVVTPFQANVPVVIGGVGVRPGDFVYADSSGAVVMPATQVREVLMGAIAVTEEDERYLEDIERERPGSGPLDTR